MNINRDNYEMYFLMYVDNELSASERSAVELFVTQNNDLKAELELLQGTALPSEKMVFIPKTLLYKNATQVESVQESLLLHLDNELTAADAATVKSQILSHAEVKDEWGILQKTKLDPKEKIIFNDKRSLYRHTENVIMIRFWRIAAAAVLIGAGIFIGISLFNKDVPADTIAITTKTGAGQKVVDRPQTSDNRQPTTVDRSAADNIVSVKKNNNISKKPILKNINIDPRNQMVQQDVKDKEDGLNTDRKELQRIETGDDIAVVDPPAESKSIERPVMEDTDISKVKESFARLAVNEENDRILYMDEDKVTRSKLGGFFRKVKRVVERNTKIKTSNGLRIGGFEFAVK